MDAALRNDLFAFVARIPSARWLGDDEAESLRVRVAARFGWVEGRLWGWEARPAHATSISYGGTDGVARLEELLPASSAPLYLFVTDDEAPPWPCVCAPKSVLAELVREHRFFEYFVVDAALEQIVFDTHHDTLVTWRADGA